MAAARAGSVRAPGGRHQQALHPIRRTLPGAAPPDPRSRKGLAAGTQSMTLIMEDRDIPKNLKADGTFLHWVVMNIPVETREIRRGEVVGVSGASGNGVSGYMGPCPPKQYEPTEHRYYFDLYALDTTLSLPEGAKVADVRAAIEGHVIAHATMMGRYERK